MGKMYNPYIDMLNEATYLPTDMYGNTIPSKDDDDDIYIVDKYGNIEEDNDLQKFNSTEHHII